MKNKLPLLSVFLVLQVSGYSQILGGSFAHAWLKTPPSPQTTALGGWQLRFDGRDPSLANWNPAALNANTDRIVSLSQDFINAGIGKSNLSAGWQVERAGGHAALSVQYVGYGEFVGRDERAQVTGDFQARDYAIGLAFAKTIDEKLHLGAQVNLIGGSIEAFNSMGAALNLGLMYTPDSAKRTIWGLQMQHAGYLWNNFGAERENLPFELSLGVSRKLLYLPLRFGVLYRRLDRWDLLYDDPDRRESNTFLDDDGTRSQASLFVDNLARHFAFNAELYLGKKEVVQIRLGYDHQRQREGKVGELRSLAGFSYGFGLNLRRWRLDYGHGIQHLGGGPHHVGLLLAI